MWMFPAGLLPSWWKDKLHGYGRSFFFRRYERKCWRIYRRMSQIRVVVKFSRSGVAGAAAAVSQSALNDGRRMSLTLVGFSYGSGRMVTVTFFPSCFPFFKLLNRSMRSGSTPLPASSLIDISKLTLNFFPRSAVDRNLSRH